VHPLTGQLYVADRSDTLQAEIDLVAPGANGGWPCLEGGDVSSGGVAACLAGHTKDEVYANHPSWSRPIVAHTGNPQVTGLAVSTSLGYPEEFYGDVFYLLRDSARIYRIDLQPPCFMPTGSELAPLVFHDSNSDNDFRAVYDIDDDEDFDNVGLSTLSAITQGRARPGRTRSTSSASRGTASPTTRSSTASSSRPRSRRIRARGRVPDSCFAGIENRSRGRRVMVPSGACAGQPDGASCDDGNALQRQRTLPGRRCTHTGNVGDGQRRATGGPPACGRHVPERRLRQRRGGRGRHAVSGRGSVQRHRGVSGRRLHVDAGRTHAARRERSMSRARQRARDGGSVSPSGAIAPSTTDAVAVTLDAGGTPAFREHPRASGQRSAVGPLEAAGSLQVHRRRRRERRPDAPAAEAQGRGLHPQDEGPERPAALAPGRRARRPPGHREPVLCGNALLHEEGQEGALQLNSVMTRSLRAWYAHAGRTVHAPPSRIRRGPCCSSSRRRSPPSI
jgi:hypothetical protein